MCCIFFSRLSYICIQNRFVSRKNVLLLLHYQWPQFYGDEHTRLHAYMYYSDVDFSDFFLFDSFSFFAGRWFFFIRHYFYVSLILRTTLNGNFCCCYWANSFTRNRTGNVFKLCVVLCAFQTRIIIIIIIIIFETRVYKAWNVFGFWLKNNSIHLYIGRYTDRVYCWLLSSSTASLW